MWRLTAFDVVMGCEVAKCARRVLGEARGQRMNETFPRLLLLLLLSMRVSVSVPPGNAHVSYMPSPHCQTLSSSASVLRWRLSPCPTRPPSVRTALHDLLPPCPPNPCFIFIFLCLATSVRDHQQTVSVSLLKHVSPNGSHFFLPVHLLYSLNFYSRHPALVIRHSTPGIRHPILLPNSSSVRRSHSETAALRVRCRYHTPM